MAAAKSLHVSASAVSQTLNKLEREIETPLFTRLHKRLVPTLAGQRLSAIVEPFMTALESCLASLAAAKDQPFGELRIGAPQEFGKAYFPALVAAFRQQYPEVTFYLHFGDPGTLLPMIESGRLDFAIVDLYLTQSQFIGNLDIYHFDPLVEEEVMLACSRQYYERSIAGDHSFDTLAKQDFITYRHDGQSVRNWFKHHFGKSNLDLRIVLTVGSHQTVISALRHHLGMGVVASHLASDPIRDGEMVPIQTDRGEIINQISRVQLKDKVPSLAEKVFGRFLVTQFKAMDICCGKLGR